MTLTPNPRHRLHPFTTLHIPCHDMAPASATCNLVACRRGCSAGSMRASRVSIGGDQEGAREHQAQGTSSKHRQCGAVWGAGGRRGVSSSVRCVVKFTVSRGCVGAGSGRRWMDLVVVARAGPGALELHHPLGNHKIEPQADHVHAHSHQRRRRHRRVVAVLRTGGEAVGRGMGRRERWGGVAAQDVPSSTRCS